LTSDPSDANARALLVQRLQKLGGKARMISSKYPHLSIVRLSGRNGHEDDLSITTAQELIEDLELAIKLIQSPASSEPS
jgi:hypothetical protein